MAKMENTFVWGKNGGGGSADLINYYTKTEIDQQQQQQDTKITTNENEIRTLTTTISDVDDKVVANITNTESNTEKIQHLTQKFSNYYTSQEIDDQQNSQNETIANNTKLISNGNITNSSTKITELGDNKVMVIAQLNISNLKNDKADLYSAFPQEVKNLNNVQNIEWFEYNFLEVKSGKNKIFMNNIGNIAASVYSNRIYLNNEGALPSYVQFVRFKLIYNKT